MISFDDFKKVELKVGEIKTAERVEGSDKLLKLTVDFGEEHPRQVVSGIGKTFSPEELIGGQFVFVVNLEPRMIMGLESQAMIVATHKKTEAGSASAERSGETKDRIVLMSPGEPVQPGSSLS